MEDSAGTTHTAQALQQQQPQPPASSSAAPVSSSSSSSSSSLAEKLVVIIVTSPLPTHPLCDVILSVLESFRHVPGLASCRTLIVCDGTRVGPRNKWKSGTVCPEVAEAYELFKANLRRLACLATSPSPLEGATTYCDELQPPLQSPPPAQDDPDLLRLLHCRLPVSSLPRLEVLELQGREGFGHAVRLGLESLCSGGAPAPPHAMIIQHDRRFRSGFSLPMCIQVCSCSCTTLPETHTAHACLPHT